MNKADMQTLRKRKAGGAFFEPNCSDLTACVTAQ